MLPEFYAAADTGRLRTNNEDSVALDAAAGVAVLADGMGGYNAGEVASGMLTSFVKAELGRWLQDHPQEGDTEVRRAMDVCVDSANRAIFNAANTNPQYAGMGTTLVLSVFRPGRVLIGHVGDSRAYRWRQGRLVQLTRDHSLLQEQIDAGLLTVEQAEAASHRNLVTRAVGVEDTVLLETQLHETAPGDLYLMCSDGLSDMLGDDDIARLLVNQPSLESVGRTLIEAANQAGGRDNIAVVLARIPGASPGLARAWWPFKR